MMWKTKGQALAEMALILPLLLILLVGIFEGARIIQSYLTVQEAARIAARYAITGQSDGVEGLWEHNVQKRAESIKTRAIQSAEQSYILISETVTDTVDYKTYFECNEGNTRYGVGDMDDCRSVFGVRVLGADTTNLFEDCGDSTQQGLCRLVGYREPKDYQLSSTSGMTSYYALDSAGLQGQNVTVEVFHNVSMIDPIFELLIPNGFLQVRASVTMKNEGLTEEPASYTPNPRHSGTPPPVPPATPNYDPDAPRIEIDCAKNDLGQCKPGTLAKFWLINHEAIYYDIYIGNQLITEKDADADNPVFASNKDPGVSIDYDIPTSDEGKFFWIYSVPSPSDDNSTFTARKLLSIAPADSPSLIVFTNNDDNLERAYWPIGTPLDYRLKDHISNLPYIVEMPPGTVFDPALTADADGNASNNNPVKVPQGAIGTGTIIRSVYMTDTNTVIASRTLEIGTPCLRLQRDLACGEGLTIDQNSDIEIQISKHTKSISYILSIQEKGTGLVPEDLNLKTNSSGFASKIYYTIKATDPNNQNFPKYYDVKSYHPYPGAGDHAYMITAASLTVTHELSPYIRIVNGYTWPAGTRIQFELRNHEPNTYYDIYWNDILALNSKQESGLRTGADGNLRRVFDIPIDATAAATHTLSSRLRTDPNTDTVSVGLEVTSAPYIDVPQGRDQTPGVLIDINLHDHSLNTEYDVYVETTKINTVNTDEFGDGTTKYTIDPNIAPGTPLSITSYPAGSDISQIKATAIYTLSIEAADLQILSIEVPKIDAFNSDVVITVTIINDSPISITHQSFDVDIYLDPSVEPNLGLALPPGDVKTWIEVPFASGATRTLTATLPIFGLFDHIIYARADTSNRVIEGTNEDNNIDSVIISASICQHPIVSSDITTYTLFGDARAPNTNNLTKIRLKTPGATTVSTDDANNGGYFYAYFPFSAAQDFTMEALIDKPLETDSVASDRGRWGFEVRPSIEGHAPKLEWGFYSRQLASNPDYQNLQVIYRSYPGDFPTFSSVHDYQLSYPIWIRLVRESSFYNLYYAPDAGNGTHGVWQLVTTPEQTFTVSLPITRTSDLVGLFASSYGGYNDVKNYDFSYFRICADTACQDVLYDINQSNTDAKNWHTQVFGNNINEAKTAIFKVTGDTFEPLTVDGDTITLNNDGSSLPDTLGDYGGYLFAHHQIDDAYFDVQVQAFSKSNPVDEAGDTLAMQSEARYGLQMRKSLADGDDQINFVVEPYSQQFRFWQRTQLNARKDHLTIPFPEAYQTDGAHAPVWLRLVRSDAEYIAYYSFETSPSAWTEAQRIDLTGENFETDVYLGLVNTPNIVGARDTAVFKNYEACADPGSIGRCGEVRESSGLAVVDTSNFTQNTGQTNTWEFIERDGRIGVTVTGGDASRVGDAAEIQYQIDFTTADFDYYVWLLGAASGDKSNEVYFDLSAYTIPNDNYYFTNETDGEIHWFKRVNRGSNIINISSQGSQTFSLWAKEEGIEIYQILLTTDPDFDPSDEDDLEQSLCSTQGVPDVPVWLEQCTSPLINGNFEDEQNISVWTFPGIQESVTHALIPHYDGNYGLTLPARRVGGRARNPWLYQTIPMPSWLITPTTVTELGEKRDIGTKMNLSLYYGVNTHDQPRMTDTLYVALVDQGSFTPTGRIKVGDGDDTPNVTETSFAQENWKSYYYDLATAFPTLVDYTNQNMRLRFWAPNFDGNGDTTFYVDNINLDICTIEPPPDTTSTKVGGYIFVFLNQVPVAQPGVFVWIYSIDGDLQKTYTIQDSSFSFYNLPASSAGTEYVIHAEYRQDGILYNATDNITLYPGQQIETINMLLLN